MTAPKHLPLLSGLALLCASAALAKLPAPSDEARAKAAEAAAKTAWGGKTDAYLLCKAQDKVVAHHAKAAKAAGKEVKPAPAALAACVDPGPFVYAPAAPAAPVASAPAAAPTAAAAPAKKP